jgi:hypothetical protein
MLGNHDTPPIWLLADQWCASGAARQQAAYLAWRLLPEGKERVYLLVHILAVRKGKILISIKGSATQLQALEAALGCI